MKDIAGYEGLYAITSCGKVWSYQSKKFLKPQKLKNGYLQVGLYKDTKRNSGISFVCNGRCKTHGGYHWEVV